MFTTQPEEVGESKSLLVSKSPPPELGSVGLGDSEVVALEQAVGEDGLELGQHVAEDQRQFGQVTSAGAEKTQRGQCKPEPVSYDITIQSRSLTVQAGRPPLRSSVQEGCEESPEETDWLHKDLHSSMYIVVSTSQYPHHNGIYIPVSTSWHLHLSIYIMASTSQHPHHDIYILVFTAKLLFPATTCLQ